jgi:O-6-methylguanine DNA methyltransferase
MLLPTAMPTDPSRSNPPFHPVWRGLDKDHPSPHEPARVRWGTVVSGLGPVTLGWVDTVTRMEIVLVRFPSSEIPHPPTAVDWPPFVRRLGPPGAETDPSLLHSLGRLLETGAVHGSQASDPTATSRAPETSPLRIDPVGKEVLWVAQGTPFQQMVWQALLRIPYGSTVSYGDLARQLGHPKATRAVGAACGANRLAWIIPCHRVVGRQGRLTGYRWGLSVKERLLDLEKARLSGISHVPGRPVGDG